MNDHCIEEVDNYLQPILEHIWVDCVCEMKVKYYTGESEFHPIDLVYVDGPLTIVNYIVNPKRSSNPKTSRMHGRC